MILLASNQVDKAIETLLEAEKIGKSRFGEDDGMLADVYYMIGEALIQKKDFEGGISRLRTVEKLYQQKFGEDSQYVAFIQQRIKQVEGMNK